MAEVCERVDWVLYSLHRESAGGSVIAVCHEDVMWAVRARIEQLSQERWQELKLSDDPRDRVHNGQVIVYTRRDPSTGEVGPGYRWTLSVCPYDSDLSRNRWERIEQPRYSNEDLLARVAAIPRLIEG